ncbi:MAG: DUF3576 domain-containing protein [Rhodobacteraceae bacterium]|nr:DUF3576 domain-containing protein [Paracoccaceae bacterium]
MRWAILAGLMVVLAGCGGGGLFGHTTPAPVDKKTQQQIDEAKLRNAYGTRHNAGTIWGLFSQQADPNVTVGVNKYLWLASLEVLDFLPKQSVDPFSGVIVTGYGTPPGGGRAYRATILVSDPALDARSLKVSLESKGGAVDATTQRAVEDAILTRARQLRIQDSKL